MKIMNEQFANPQGVVGKLAGFLMQAKDKNQSSWVISNSRIKPNAKVLEIGYGPGLGIESASGFAYEGFTAGIDISNVMLMQASKRNAENISKGKIKLLQGNVNEIPFEDNYFDMVFSVNTMNYWEDLQQALKEIKRVLKPGGEVCISLHPKWFKIEADSILLREEIKASVETSGFKNVKANQLNLKPVSAFCIYGIK